MPQNKIQILFILAANCFALQTYGQEDAKMLYDGNNMYYSGKVMESSAKYAKALELNAANKKANFNLGNALYKNAELIKSGQVQVPPSANMTPDSLSGLILDQAAENFAVVANSVSNPDTLHQAWHNIGNCYLMKKDYKQAVDAYKKSLKYNSKDEDTRYNLAYALKHLPKEKKGGGGGGQQNQQNKKQEDKKDKDKNAAPQQNQMNKEQAEQLLKALMNNEKKLQEKRKQKAQNAENQTLDKDW